ncbi:MarR family winged helix-turn-helix transcriptional regulator [Marinactinospora thermotolerans]|uniref:DNA-binding transcriptional regulator, MarR family n=1 Tax=Marinactinospora thermotolerans DSM 45154 TaxID=1122192 RepID=A0A1T4SK16_9ACTN|nr:MarR family transcriptional regulator [Marinactinospora thermotolerans]SKA28527.1 DNA-binding transcriptional regulator, MarR family [Marinactinospora thermotolerans DSM 45154]
MSTETETTTETNTESPVGEGAGGCIDDDELITAWGLLHEALTTLGPLLLRGIDPCGHDMSGPWFEVLLRLQRSPQHRLPMSRLAREVSLSSGGFTKLADRLERNGYLARQSCPSDRRVTYAVLTPEGLELAEQARRRHVELLRLHVLQPLGKGALRDLADHARTLRDHARERTT